jgi:mannose-1-phosphate guanylyltransferase
MESADYVAILAGGVGSRFWPLSRTDHPKQFLDILGSGETLIQQTFHRFERWVPAEHIYVVTAEEYVPLVRQQLPALPPGNILGEPMRRNTAACIAYISYKLYQQDPEGSLIVSPADHYIPDDEAFAAVCRKGLEFTRERPALVTLGIRPTYPSTGYGYIQKAAHDMATGIYPVKRFIEKPYLELARTFVQSDDFFWNAGIFIWKLRDILDAFRQYLPGIYDAFSAIRQYLNTPDEKHFITRIYPGCMDISIDFGIMERSEQVYMIPAAFEWSDLGSWTSAWENMKKGEDLNAVSGEKVLIIDSARCMVHSTGGRLLVLQGMDDFIVADTADVLLICRKEREQDIKQYVAEVRKLNGE